MRNCVSRRVVVPTGGREAMVGGRTFSLGKYIRMLHKQILIGFTIVFRTNSAPFLDN